MSTKEHLVQAAKELLWERGYEAMSPRTILERSGAGQGSFYHHFEGKADLAATAMHEVADEMLTAYQRLLHSDRPALERIKAYLLEPREALRGCRLGRMTQEEVLSQERLRAPIVSYFSSLENVLAKVIQEAQQDKSLDPAINSEELAATLVAIVQGGYVLARAFQNPQQMEQAIHGALALLAASERR